MNQGWSDGKVHDAFISHHSCSKKAANIVAPCEDWAYKPSRNTAWICLKIGLAQKSMDSICFNHHFPWFSIIYLKAWVTFHHFPVEPWPFRIISGSVRANGTPAIVPSRGWVEQCQRQQSLDWRRPMAKWRFPAHHGGTPIISWMVDFHGKIQIQKGWWLGVALWLRKPPNGKLKAGTNQWTHFSGLSETSPRLIHSKHISRNNETRDFNGLYFCEENGLLHRWSSWDCPRCNGLRPKVLGLTMDHTLVTWPWIILSNMVIWHWIILFRLITMLNDVKQGWIILLHGHRKNICKAKGLEVEGECSAMSKRWSNINISFHYFSLPKKTWFDSEMLATCPTNIYQLHQPLSPLAAASSSLVPANWRLQMQLVF